MAIERCDRCGKAFMSRSEVERHRVHEYSVGLSPFEEKFAFDSPRNNSDLNKEDLHKMTTDLAMGKSNNDVTDTAGR
jgi:hypothetical protein